MEKRYAEIITGIDLMDIFLAAVQYKRLAFPDPENYPEVKATFSAGKADCRQEGAGLEVHQEVRFLLEEMGKDGKKSRKIFQLKGTFTLVYKTPAPMDEELFELFKSRNIPLNLHPYVRELIQNAMARTGLPPFTLPVIKIKR